MKLILLFWFCILIVFGGNAQTYFPSSNQWDTASPSSIGWCTSEIPTLLDYLDESNTKAFIVLKDGKIAMEHYFDSFTQDSAWYWASAGKSLRAFMIGIAQEKGDLSIQDPVSDYLGTGWTSLTAAQEDSIKIIHQLTMTTGIDDNVPDLDCTLPSCLNYLAEPGTRWSYHNGPYTLVRDVLESATGQTNNVFFNQQIGSRTGMTGIFLPFGYNSLFLSKARSMARFGLLVSNDGVWDGDTILGDTAYMNAMLSPSQNLNKAYGYLWWLNGQTDFMIPGLQIVFQGPLMPNAPLSTKAAIGKNGQIINIVEEEGLVVVRMGDSPSNLLFPSSLNDSIWKYLNPVVFCNTTSTHENLDLASALKVYPNPVISSISWISRNPTAPFEITNFSGQTVLNGQDVSAVDVSSLPSGFYFFKQESHVVKFSKL